uniref:TIL domain-containing protein n=1 Tax=Syphacia muris TaxID=451379 RepID=A0A0N5AMH0_9BILA
MNPDSERFPEDDDDQIKDYEELNEIRNSIYPFKARNENSDVTDLFTSFLDRTAIQEIMNHIKKMLYCGPQGWCGFTCCPRSRQWTFTPQPLALSFGRRRFKPKRCTLACMPHCTTQCLLYQAYRPNPDTTMQIQYPPKALVEATNPQPIPLCRPSCMPSCLKECLMEPVAICRPACMPQCTPACVNSLPMMIKCPLPEVCICPPGYVQCSEDTCCMRYRTMAIKYSNQMPAYTFDDANVTDANVTIQKNETLVFPNDSHELDGQKAYDLKKNGTIIYHPENLTGEIIYDDGEVFVDGTLASAVKSDSVNASN